MNTKLKLLIIVALVGISALVSGLFFSEYFIVAPLFIKTRSMVVKRTSAQEYAQREAQMIKQASEWVNDYTNNPVEQKTFKEGVKNIMDK